MVVFYAFECLSEQGPELMQTQAKGKHNCTAKMDVLYTIFNRKRPQTLLHACGCWTYCAVPDWGSMIKGWGRGEKLEGGLSTVCCFRGSHAVGGECCGGELLRPSCCAARVQRSCFAVLPLGAAQRLATPGSWLADGRVLLLWWPPGHDVGLGGCSLLLGA